MDGKQKTTDDRYYLHYDNDGKFEYASSANGRTVYVPNHERYNPTANPDAAEFLSLDYDLSDRPESVRGLQEAIELCLAEVSAIAKQMQDQAVEQYSAGEISTWDRKEADAQSILKGGSGAMLEHESRLAGIPVATLAALVARKADEYRLFSATVAGVRGSHQQAIGRLRSVEAVIEYVADGWPSL